MNFISQLHNSKHFNDFAKWFLNKNYPIKFGILLFLDLPMEFQQGVFIKYIESKGYKVVKRSHWFIQYDKGQMQRKKFEDFILEIFNNDQF